MRRFNLIVAVSEGLGIGLKGDLPWKLRSELKYFSQTTKQTSDPGRRNAVIMGRKTYFGIPESKRPLRERLNIVLSTTLQREDLPDGVLLYPSLEAAMEYLEGNQQIENVWVVGGSRVYAEAIDSPRCFQLYITRILQQFECDTFFPEIPDCFRELDSVPGTPLGVQEENGTKYEYIVLEKES
ncbi:hypothetical protein KR018_002692 [Drosophila ironensis]|nr:hypothetical protein KR018_002692 [Drosophila ironensis]